MDQYLLQILKETNTIIIPDLGALTITNTDTGETMFMPFLKHDDGKLSGHIAAKEGIEENEAKNIVAKHVREIKSKLDQGESYVMFEFGTFSKNDDGDIEFTNWKSGDTATPTETPTPEVIEKEPPTKTKVAEDVKEEPVIVSTTEPVVEEAQEEVEEQVTEDITEESKIEESEPEVEGKEAPDKKEEVIEEQPEVTPIPTPEPAKETPSPKKEMNILEKEELAANSKKLNQLKADKDSQKNRKKRGIGFYLLIVLILILVGGGTFVGIYYDEVKQHIPFLADNTKDNKEEPSEIDKMKDMIGEDEVADESDSSDENTDTTDITQEEEMSEEMIEEPIVEEPEVITPTPVSDGSLPFHIVAGAFGSPENAERLAEKIRGMGYPATTFKRGNMTIVSVKSFATKAEAQAAVSTVQDATPSGWVLEWRN
jgi:nucleoid DNA-binding protein